MDRDTHNFRFEAKYQVPEKTSGFIEADIKKFGMQADEHTLAEGGYYVTSLYFDSYDFSDYQDKAGGFLKRKKIRARIYEPYLDKSENVWLEIKKRYDIKNTKTRLKLNREQWDEFAQKGPWALLDISKNGEAPKAAAANEILGDIIRFSLKPKLLVRYWRRPFLNGLKDLRITFDSNLEACKTSVLEYNGFVERVNKNAVVMEVKFDYLIPFWLKKIIKNYNLKRDAFSKYGQSLEAVYKYNPLSR